MVKTIGIPRKVNAILLNIKITQPTCVKINLKQIDKICLISLSENIAKSVKGYFFDSHCRSCDGYNKHRNLCNLLDHHQLTCSLAFQTVPWCKLLTSAEERVDASQIIQNSS